MTEIELHQTFLNSSAIKLCQINLLISQGPTQVQNATEKNFNVTLTQNHFHFQVQSKFQRDSTKHQSFAPHTKCHEV